MSGENKRADTLNRLSKPLPSCPVLSALPQFAPIPIVRTGPPFHSLPALIASLALTLPDARCLPLCPGST